MLDDERLDELAFEVLSELELTLGMLELLPPGGVPPPPQETTAKNTNTHKYLATIAIATLTKKARRC